MRRELVVGGLLLLLTLAIFWQVGDHEFLNYDDTVYVTSNPHVLQGLTASSVYWAFTARDQANWHPLTWLSHMLDWELFGLNPRGHHLFSVILHGANALLLFIVLTRMTGAIWKAAFVAALFALHPLHVESVAWVAERKDVLSAFLGLATLFFYAWYVGQPSKGRYVWVVVAFALALMAKPMLVTLPFVLLLLDYWPLARIADSEADEEPRRAGKKALPRIEKRSVLSLVIEKAPLFGLAAACSVVTFIYQRSSGAMAETDRIPFDSRLANALVSYLRYIGKMVWPSDLAVLYPHPGASLPMWQAAMAGVALLAISVVAVVTLRRRPYLAVGWFWFLGTLVPVIGLIQVGTQALADRYTYLPLIGLFIAIAWGIPDLLGKRGQSVLAASAVAALAALTIATSIQLRYWQNSISLFTHAVATTSGNYTAHHNLANALADKGRGDDAILHYTEALRIKRDHADSYNNWGSVLLEQAKVDEAVDRFRMALKLKPESAEAHSNLGAVYQNRGQSDQAIAEFSEAVRLNPEYVQARNNLALALAGRGRSAEAVAHYEEAIRLRPDYIRARNNLAILFVQLGRLNEAEFQLREALRINPGFQEARTNLAIVLDKMGNPPGR